jgi:hypothetical protein
MFSVFRNRSYRHLFLAQVIALVGTGLATVALGFAFLTSQEIKPARYWTALAIKMIAIGVAPIASAFSERLPRRTTLVTLISFAPLWPFRCHSLHRFGRYTS